MKRNESKALARIKRVYKSYSEWYVHKFKKLCNNDDFSNFKLCESITEFIDKSKYAKLLKKTRVPFRSKMLQNEHRYENRRKRHEAKKQIQESLQLYKSEYDEDPTCGNCEWFNKGECLESGEQVHADDPVCREFRD